ncbi:tetratricopeptide repeat-containing protein [Oceanobacillus arenosus]|uniref:Tetratricopeptide repeat-containing protein n=1 Tax=Oceanobacillus arenosus TaxID=1229153 RepID=A0A3D8PT81_9BACI|nr:tetratricopeptide repeat protein [Oceanobacillus arenosus]RDW19333.1 tetratricopeptide repeat-containing protein [Oceanobacillus arenosus]
MYTEPNNVILFPKWKKTLEEESLYALQEKRYEEALQKLNKLLSFQVDNYEIIIAKLMCLMELARYEEAQSLCETLIEHKDENYYHYVHMYLTILFQTNQYEVLMEHAASELANKQLPEIFREQFTQLYDISKKMKVDIMIEKSVLLQDELTVAIEQEDHQEQWRIMENLRRMNARANDEIAALLVNKAIHPVIKTAIVYLLKDNHVAESVAVQKFDINTDVIPIEAVEITESAAFNEILFLVKDIEFENPTLYAVIKQILQHYLFVLYPIAPHQEVAYPIAEALKLIGMEYLNIHIESHENLEPTVLHYVDEIKMCETLYMSIIEE